MLRKIDSLERLLSAAGVPNAKEDAEALLNKFGSMSYLMQCDSYALQDHTSCSDKTLHVIRLAAELTSRRITDRFRPGKKYSSEQLKQFAVGLMLAHTAENAYCILLGASGKLIAAEWLGEGIVNSVGISPRKVIELAYKSGAKQVILVHNHPCGNPNPSSDDIHATMTFRNAADSSGIELLAHYVVSGFNICDVMGGLPGASSGDDESGIMRVGIPLL